MTHDCKPNSGGLIAVVLLVTAPLLYVLSVGPVEWLIENEYFENDGVVAAFYMPLSVACEACSPLKRVLLLYCRLWIDIE